MKRRPRHLAWLGLAAVLAAPGCADRIAPADAALDHAPPACVEDAPLPPSRLTRCSESPSTVSGTCWDWARSHTFAEEVRAWCTFDSGAFCIQVTDGPDNRRPDAAFVCGNEPPCGTGFVCVAAYHGAPFHCECITR